MKKLLAVITLFLFLIEAHAQLIPKNPNKKDKKGRQGTWTITFDARWKPTKHKDSIAFYRVLTYLNDKPQGLVTDFYLSGKKQWQGEVLQDRPEDVLVGKVTWYYENGNKQQEAHFDKGIKHGLDTEFYENGNKKKETYYNAGKVEGRVVHYDEQGNLAYTEIFQADTLLSNQQAWNIGIELYNKNKYKEAEPYFESVYSYFKHNDLIESENGIFAMRLYWNSLYGAGKPKEALPIAQDLMRVCDLLQQPHDTLRVAWVSEVLGLYKTIQDYAPMEKLIFQKIEILKRLVGEAHPDHIEARRLLADYYRLVERFEESEKVFLDNIAYLKKTFPTQPEKYTYDLAALGYMHEMNKNYPKAEKLYEEAIISYQNKQDTSATYTSALAQLISIYLAQNKIKEVVPHCITLIALQKKRKGEISSEYALALHELMKAYREGEQFEKSDSVWQIRVQITEKLYGQKSYEYGQALLAKALLEQARGRNREAEKYFLETIEIMKLPLPAHQTNAYKMRWAETLTYLGDLYASEKDFLKADLVMTEAFEKVNAIQDKKELAIVFIYETIGRNQMTIGNYDFAKEAYMACLAISKALFGENHRTTIVAQANLCTLASYQGRPEMALQVLETLMQKVASDLGKDSDAYRSLLDSKMVALNALQKYHEIITIRQEHLVFIEKMYGKESDSYRRSFSKLIYAQIHAKQFEEAKQHIDVLQQMADRKGIKTIDKVYYDEILPLKLFWATAQNKHEQALEYAQEQNAIGRFLGKPKMGLAFMALQSFTIGKFADALNYYKSYINLVMDEIDKIFPYLSESQKVGFYNHEIQYHLDLFYFFTLAEPMGMRLGLDSLQKKAEAERIRKIQYVKHPNTADVFNLLLTTKGIIFESSQKMKKNIMESQDQDLIKLYETWQNKKDALIKLIADGGGKSFQDKKNALQEEIIVIEKKLALKSAYFSQKTNAKNYTWQDVQKKLKKGEALVEILPISAGIKLEKSKYADLYLAFIVTPETKDSPLCVKLGNGDSLENKYMNNYRSCIKYNRKDKYSYNKYWKPIADTLKSVQKVYFAPDGVYHKISLNTLQNPETGKFILEEKNIHFISQARDFITQTLPTYTPPTKITLFGAPSYNTLPNDTPQKPDKISEQNSKGILNTLKKDTTQRFIQGNEISELQGTKVEVENIEKIAQESQITIEKFLEQDATEANLKSVQNPSVLHIATHGFFIGQSHIALQQVGEAGEKRGFAHFEENELKNPLRRSGILLAHCKQAFTQTRNKKLLPEDGILLAEEAQNLKLDKTELVVLSACETGLGDINNGQGVYGLQRAFHTAGAKSVLMSLWTVSDEATQELMTEFYKQWFKLKDKREAFRQAQLYLKEKYANPYYWGAFILVGE